MKQLLLVYFMAATLSAAPLCKKWGERTVIGKVSADFLPEASGLAVSRRYQNRIYHHNDSGDGPNFYITDFKGKLTNTVEISGLDPDDMEDMAIGPCGLRNDCLYFADAGDNDLERDYSTIAIVEEKEVFEKRVQPKKLFDIEFSGGSRNIEAIAVDPNENIFLFSKEDQGKDSVVFKIEATQIQNQKYRIRIHPKKIMKLPVGDWLGEDAQVSAADLSPDGSRLLLLSTNGKAVELDWNNIHNKKQTPKMISLHQKKTEAIGYLPDSSGFIFSAEAKDEDYSPLGQVLCALLY